MPVRTIKRHRFSATRAALQPTAPYDRIVTLVSAERQVPTKLILNASRCRSRASKARHLAMYLAHVVFGESLARVGVAFGRDRTTVSHACAQIEDLRDDPSFDAEICRLERCLQQEGVSHDA
ncbi:MULTISPECIES: helix-turn-helix domain-containing protein [Devosia]|uniref:Chromosomal replication initiator protein DnaA n=1 Tax=Devosia equisanguinis TaxID=2490941 RepID=A0A447IGS2_9HYPH|nr:MULTISPECIES: helix-turn-helix domain-containing protein [Devosia]VDS06677.1 Chromosomal replication initiator protein DnaA [Devosia equisanguinis]